MPKATEPAPLKLNSITVVPTDTEERWPVCVPALSLWSPPNPEQLATGAMVQVHAFLFFPFFSKVKDIFYSDNKYVQAAWSEKEEKHWDNTEDAKDENHKHHFSGLESRDAHCW